MKTVHFAVILFLAGMVYQFSTLIASNYKYSSKYSSYWDLADRQSTITGKKEYIDRFVENLDKSGLKGKHNAVFYKTPNNSFNNNLKALKSLQSRLTEIQHMDQNSFEYQTALQQITEQEQGQADDMLSGFRGTWYKEYYWNLWSWKGFIVWTILILGFVGSVAFWMEDV